MVPHIAPFHRFRVSLILGAEGVSSVAAITGGLVASGEGTWRLLWPKPRELLRLGVNGGGLPADPDAAAAAGVGVAGGCAPELNSAQRGHLRFVSVSEKINKRKWKVEVWGISAARTHMTHLSAVAAASLKLKCK